MNTKIIIYDDNCPICSAYTNAFVKTGLLDKGGRKNFSTITPELLSKIDFKKSVNEIPVIDTASGQVWYGINALLEILQGKIPFAKSIGNIQFIKWSLTKFYKFISYNRRVLWQAKEKTQMLIVPLPSISPTALHSSLFFYCSIR
jgi:predicted DCC family thiol-disulfide oxidoreductase YuxK